jgi:hypothetical protein
MDRKLILLRYNGSVHVPDHNDRTRDEMVIAKFLDLLRLNVVDYISCENDHGEPFDNTDDDLGELLFNDETIFEVRLQMDIERPGFFHDFSHNILKYVYDSLNNALPFHISNLYSTDYDKYNRTVIEIMVDGNSI